MEAVVGDCCGGKWSGAAEAILKGSRPCFFCFFRAVSSTKIYTFFFDDKQEIWHSLQSEKAVHTDDPSVAEPSV
jgi:hypothetical protein